MHRRRIGKLSESALVFGGLALTAVLLVQACASEIGIERMDSGDIDRMAGTPPSRLLPAGPELQRVLDTAVGCMVVAMQVANIPGVGRGAGTGSMIDSRDQISSYEQVSQLELGGGMGVESSRFVIFFTKERLLDKAMSGSWFYQAGAQAETRERGVERTNALSGEGHEAYRISEGAIVVSVTVRAARVEAIINR